MEDHVLNVICFEFPSFPHDFTLHLQWCHYLCSISHFYKLDDPVILPQTDHIVINLDDFIDLCIGSYPLDNFHLLHVYDFETFPLANYQKVLIDHDRAQTWLEHVQSCDYLIILIKDD